MAADDALARTRAMMGADDQGEVRGLIGRVLGDLRGIKVVLQATFALLEDTDEATFTAVHALPPAQGLGALGVHLTEVLQYMDGSGRYTEPHREPLAALRTMALSCDAATTLRALAGLLALDVKTNPDGALVIAPHGAGERAWLSALVDVTQRALAEPELTDALARIELEDTEAPAGDDGIRVGRPAFQVLFHIVAANLAAPDFDPVFTRQLIDDVLLALIDGAAARAATDAMLDVFFLPMEPAAAVFLDAQAFLSCVDEGDPERALSGMLFDWLTVEGLSPGTFIDDVAQQAGSDAAAALRPVAVRLFTALSTRSSLAADTARVASHFLSDENAAASVRLIIGLKGQGVLAELLGFFDELKTCR